MALSSPKWRFPARAVLGDATYGGTKPRFGTASAARDRFFKDLFATVLARPALHATTLAFAHPRSGPPGAFTRPGRFQ